MTKKPRIIKNRFYTGADLAGMGLNKEKIKVADRQGLLIGIAIDKPSHQVTSLGGNTYALAIPKTYKAFYEDMNISPYSKKIYYGENINYWLKNRIDPSVKIQGKKKGQALRKLSDKKINENYIKWSEKYDEALNKKLGKSFTKTYKVKNHSYDEKEFSPDKFKSKQVYRRFIK
tara:strand:- start:626 stop:1147 length:522 start_codon:yes stop_codon:yes gene_type:complete